METKIPLRDVMVREVVKSDQDVTVLEAAKLMGKYDVDCIVVLDHGEPVGIVTEGDIISELVSKDRKSSKVRLKDIMTTPLIIASPDDSLSDIAKMMARERIRRIPILGDGKLVGIVTDIDILSASSEMNSIMSELAERDMERELVDEEGEGLGQGICEKCGCFSHYLELKDGLMICEGCNEELELETED